MHVSYVFFVIQGFGTLLTWNSILNCPDFFLVMYNSYVISIMSGCFMAMNFLGVLFFTFVPRTSFKVMTIIPYTLFFIPMVIIGPIFGFCGGDNNAKYVFTVILSGFCGLLQAILQTAVFERAGKEGSNEIQAVMFGQGIVGIVMSVLRIITKLTIENYTSQKSKWDIETKLVIGEGADQRFKWSILVYFVVAMIGNLICLISVLLYKKRSNFERINEEEEGEKKLLRVLRVNWLQYLEVFFIFFATLSVFPGVSALVPTTTWPGTPFDKKNWMPVVMSTLFCFFDFAGRFQSRSKTRFHKDVVLVNTLLRIGFLVIFLFLVNPPRIFSNDFFPFTLMVVMAYSNGFISTYISTEIVRRTSEHVDAYNCGLATKILAIFMVGGVMAGSLMSIFWAWVGQTIN